MNGHRQIREGGRLLTMVQGGMQLLGITEGVKNNSSETRESMLCTLDPQ